MNTVLSENSLDIRAIELKKASLILRAINHELRQQIISIIHEKGRVSVTEIYIKLRLEQSVASQHLAILRKAGFVKTDRSGKFIFYSLDYDRLREVHEIAGKLLTIRERPEFG